MINLFNKKFQTKSSPLAFAILLLVASFFALLPLQFAHAQATGSTVSVSSLTAANGWTLVTSQNVPGSNGTATQTYTNTNGSKASCSVYVTAYGASPNCTITAANGTQSQSTGLVTAAGTVTTSVPQPASSTCSLTNWIPCISAGVAAVALALLGFAGFLLGVVGSLFNWVVVITVFQFGAYFGNSAGLLTAWGILRDIGNIMLLFGFIFMGILMILDLHTIDTRKAIPQLIIVAVLLNFSLFVAEAVIDVSNVLSAALYNQAGGAGCATNATTAACANTGIAAQVITASGLNTIFTSFSGVGNAITAIAGDPTHAMIVYIGLTLFVSVTMVVLLAAAIMLIIRAVVLTFVMVLAPIGFAAMALPPLAGIGKQWRDMLIKEAFFAPLYLLLLLVSLKIMSAVKTALTGTANATLLDALSNPSTNSGTIFIVFALVIGFMIAALMIAKQVGAVGASFAQNVAQKGVQRTMTAPLRVGGIGVRHVAGGTATRFGRGYDATIGNWRESKNPFLKGLALTARGLGVDEAIHGGVHQVTSTKFGTSRSFDEDKKHRDERTQHLAHANEIATLNKDLQAGTKTGATTTEKDKAERALQKMAQADKELALKNAKDSASRANIARMFTADSFEKAMESKDLNAQTQEQAAKDRYEEVEEAHTDYKAGTKTFSQFKDTIRKLSTKDKKLFAKYEGTLFDNVLSEIDPTSGEAIVDADEAETMSKDDGYTSSQRAKIYGTRRSEQIKVAIAKPASAARTTEIKALMDNMGKEAGKMKKDVWLNPDIAPYLTQQHLSSAVSENNIKTAAEKKQILDNIQNHFTAAGPTNDPEYLAMQHYVNSNQAAKAFFGNTRL